MNIYSKKISSKDNYYEGLLTSSKMVRNRLIIFAILSIYFLLTILSISDVDIYLQNPIDIPGIDAKLPIKSFFIVGPIIYLIIYFNLLYTLKMHKIFLLKTEKKEPHLIKILPFGLYEGTILWNGRLRYILNILMFFMLYILPIVILVAFWVRFADYQSLLISSLHMFFIFISIILIIAFFNLLTKRNSYKTLKYVYATLIFIISILIILYHKYFLYPLMKKNVTSTDIDNYNTFIEKFTNRLNIDKETIMPIISIKDKILVKIDKEQLEVLQDFKSDLKQKKSLLLYIPIDSKNKRNFRKIILTNTILPNTKFINSEFQGAHFKNVKLQGSNFDKAKLIMAFIENTNLCQANFKDANLTKITIYKSNFNNVNLENSNLKEAQIEKSKFKHTILWNTHMGKTYISNCNFSHTSIWDSNFQKAYLNEVNLSKANIKNADFTDATLDKLILTNTTIINTQLKVKEITRIIKDNINLKNSNIIENNKEKNK